MKSFWWQWHEIDFWDLANILENTWFEKKEGNLLLLYHLKCLLGLSRQFLHYVFMYTVKKVSDIPSSAGMNNWNIPGQGESGKWHPGWAGDGKIANLFYSVAHFFKITFAYCSTCYLYYAATHVPVLCDTLLNLELQEDDAINLFYSCLGFSRARTWLQTQATSSTDHWREDDWASSASLRRWSSGLIWWVHHWSSGLIWWVTIDHLVWSGE